MENKIEILEKILIELDDNYTVSVPETRKNIDAAIGKIVKLFDIPAVVGQSEQLPDANKHQCNCSNAKDRLDCGFECYNK